MILQGVEEGYTVTSEQQRTGACVVAVTQDVKLPLPLPNAVRNPAEQAVEVQTYLESKLQPVVAVTVDAISVAVQSRAPSCEQISAAEAWVRKL